MRKLVLLCVLGAFLLLYTPVYAFADSPPTVNTINMYPKQGFSLYLTAKAGYTSPFITLQNTTKFRSAFVFGGAFGGMYRFEKPFALRLELEYLYRTNVDASFPYAQGLRENLSTLIQSVLANIYCDWYVTPKAVLYASTGFGVSVLRFSISETGARKNIFSNEFAWQLGIGFSYTLTKHIIFDCNIRYTNLLTRNTQIVPILKIKDASTIDTLIGIRYVF